MTVGTKPCVRAYLVYYTGLNSTMASLQALRKSLLPELPEVEEVGNLLVETSNSDSNLPGLIHDSCSQAEDSESRVV